MITLQPASIEPLSPSELAAEIASATAALADIETRYRRDREGILRWLGPDVAKKRLLARLDASRASDREELVRWVTQVHRHASLPSVGETVGTRTMAPA